MSGVETRPEPVVRLARPPGKRHFRAAPQGAAYFLDTVTSAPLATPHSPMIKKLLFVTTMLLALALVAAAADVTGKWAWEQAGRQGGNPVQVSLALKAEGSKLTGTLTRPGRDGMMDTAISDGKIDGDNISFKVTMQFGDNSFTTDYAGTVSGNEMKLKITRPGRNGGEPMTTEVTAKKSST